MLRLSHVQQAKRSDGRSELSTGRTASAGSSRSLVTRTACRERHSPAACCTDTGKHATAAALRPRDIFFGDIIFGAFTPSDHHRRFELCSGVCTTRSLNKVRDSSLPPRAIVGDVEARNRFRILWIPLIRTAKGAAGRSTRRPFFHSPTSRELLRAAVRLAPSVGTRWRSSKQTAATPAGGYFHSAMASRFFWIF